MRGMRDGEGLSRDILPVLPSQMPRSAALLMHWKTALMQKYIVIITSDHGYHMGEKDQLFKHTVWEESMRVPMVFRFPERNNSGLICDHPVGLIDLYPTLIELCGISDNTIRNQQGHLLDGHSLLPFLEDPVNGSWNGPDVALSCIGGGIPLEKK